MAKIINIQERFGKGKQIQAENVTFHYLDWGGIFPAIVHQNQSEVYQNSQDRVSQPLYIELKGSLYSTLLGLYRHRESYRRMRQVYLLAGLTEVATGLSCHVLRTDLIRNLLKWANDLSNDLGVVWSSWQEGFLLPLPEHLYHSTNFHHKVVSVDTYRAFAALLKEETAVQLSLLKDNYHFYVPPSWARACLLDPH